MNQEPLLGMRILIVDDEPVNIALLEDLLQFSGYSQVVSTSDGRRVLGLCLERRPDLILLDLNMPLLDGFGVLKQLSGEIDPNECVPILVLTADIGLETKRRALSAGRDGFSDEALRPRRGAAAHQEPAQDPAPASATERPENPPGRQRARTHRRTARNAFQAARRAEPPHHPGTSQRARLDDGGHRARFQQRALADPRLQRDAHAQPPAARRRADGQPLCWARSSPPRRTPPRCSTGCGNSTVRRTRGNRAS